MSVRVILLLSNGNTGQNSAEKYVRVKCFSFLIVCLIAFNLLSFAYKCKLCIDIH